MFALIASLAVVAAAPIPDRFAGGFIQLDMSNAHDPSSRLVQKEWGQVLAAMRKAEMTTVIIQRLAYRQADNGVDKEFDVLRPGEPDAAAEAILAAADRRGMSVFLGLWEAGLSDEAFADDSFLKDAEARSSALLERIKAHPAYTRHASFGGWYLPVETWNFKETGSETQRIRDCYLAPLGRKCKDVADRPVAFSCHFNPDVSKYADPAGTATTYANVLKNIKVDILLPQDGIGAFGHSAGDCKAYFKAYKDACGASGVKPWAVLECFTRGVDGAGFPCRAPRLVGQFDNAHGLAEAFIAFDFFHYMNPNAYNWASGEEIETLCAGGSAASRKCLFDGYLRLITTGP